jgi:hypothetical protein
MASTTILSHQLANNASKDVSIALSPSVVRTVQEGTSSHWLNQALVSRVWWWHKIRLVLSAQWIVTSVISISQCHFPKTLLVWNNYQSFVEHVSRAIDLTCRQNNVPLKGVLILINTWTQPQRTARTVKWVVSDARTLHRVRNVYKDSLTILLLVHVSQDISIHNRKWTLTLLKSNRWWIKLKTWHSH